MKKYEFEIKELGYKKNVWVYLPYDYDDNSNEYRVFYMQDAQNIFEKEKSYSGISWGVLEQYNNIGQEQMIVVGIEHGSLERGNEYLPFVIDSNAQDMFLENDEFYVKNKHGGKANIYLKWLVEKLKPWVDKNYRTSKNKYDNVVVGSSMGGVFSLYAGIKYPHVFGSVCVISPAFWLCFEEFKNEIKDVKDLNILMTVGDCESEFLNIKNAYVDYFLKMKLLLKESNLKCKIIEQGIHSESSWSLLLNDIARITYE